MMIEEKEPKTAPPRQTSRRGLLHRLRRSWVDSGLNAVRWKLQTALYDLWHPRLTGGGSSYGHRRVTLPRYLGRMLAQPFLQLGLWLRFRVLSPLSEWWRPASGRGDRGGTVASGRRRNRLSQFFLRLFTRLGQTAAGSWVGQVRHNLSDFGHRLFGGSRSGRPSAWHRVQRRLADTWLARKYSALAFRLHDWWYPVAGASDDHAGYGRRRRSRPAILWGKAARLISNTWLGRLWHEGSFRLYEWWYPPFDSSVPGSSRGQFRRVSRPVIGYRRWRHWLRKTWVGREFGWLLDIVADALFSARHQMTRGVAWHRLERLAARPSTYIVGGTLVVGLAAGVYFGLPNYRRYLENQYSMQARLFLEKGDLERAALRARQALVANPENAEAVGVVAELTERSHSPAALHWRARAANLAPTPGNRLALARTAIRLEQFPFTAANREVRELMPVMATNDAYLVTAGLLAVKMGDIKTAEQRFSDAVRVNPGNAEAQASLAALRLQGGEGAARDLARATLESLAAEGGAGLSPLRSLVAEAFNRKDFAAAEKLSTQLLTNSAATFSDGIVHAALLKTTGATNFSTFLADLQLRALQHPSSVGELATWMNHNGLAAEGRAWLRGVLGKAPKQTLLRVALADTYVTLKDWAGLEEWLSTERWPGLEHLRLAMLSLAMRNQNSTDHRVTWDRAVSLASPSPAALNSLARVTATWGWDLETEQVLWVAARRYKVEKWPLDGLKQIYGARKDAIGLRRLFQEMGLRDPNDLLARNNFASLSLLLNKDVTAAAGIAHQLYRNNPTNAVFAATYAYALQVQGRAQDGLEVLSKLREDQRRQPGIAVYEGLLLSALGRHEDARPLLEMANKAFLLPEEDALVRAALKAASSSR